MCNKRGSVRYGAAVWAAGTVLFTAAVLVLLSSCRPNVNYIKRMQALEEGVGSPQTEEEIVAAIQKYQGRVEDIMAAQGQVGVWYKILGVRYLDNRMYGEARGNTPPTDNIAARRQPSAAA